MKRVLIPLVLGFFTVISLSGCLEDDCLRTETFIRYDPVYIPADSIRPDIEVTEPRELCNTGGIYYYGGYLLINERREGIHVIDNSDPANPSPVAFISIPGNLDMAVNKGILYADLYRDLVAIDISDISNARITGRVDGVFASWYPLAGDDRYIVNYVPSEHTVEIDCSDDRFGDIWFFDGPALFTLANVDMSIGSAEFANATGIGGSMARFTVSRDHLYTIDDWQMRVFDLATTDPAHVNTIDLSWGIETLFPYDDFLFVGSNAGMFIYDNSDPASPQFMSEFIHAQSCDPVFVQDDIAFVTLRDGNQCQGFTNQLEVIDVTDMRNPQLIAQYPMLNPHGLSVSETNLYLCEGSFGFKVFNKEDVTAIDKNLLTHETGIHGFDVIVLPGEEVAIVVGQEGLVQYDITDRSALKELSRMDTSCN